MDQESALKVFSGPVRSRVGRDSEDSKPQRRGPKPDPGVVFEDRRPSMACLIDWCLLSKVNDETTGVKRMASKHFYWTSRLALRLTARLSLTPHQHYRHRFGVVTSFALFQTETYLHNSPNLSPWRNSLNCFVDVVGRSV